VLSTPVWLFDILRHHREARGGNLSGRYVERVLMKQRAVFAVRIRGLDMTRATKLDFLRRRAVGLKNRAVPTWAQDCALYLETLNLSEVRHRSQ